MDQLPKILKIGYILKFLLIPFLCLSQIKVDTINYRAFTLTEFFDNKEKGDISDILFVFRGNVVFTTIDDQRRAFYIKDNWKDNTLETGHNIKIVQVEDNGGFNCALIVGYDEKSGANFIVIDYNNVAFFYECREEVIPVSEDQIYIYEIESP